MFGKIGFAGHYLGRPDPYSDPDPDPDLDPDTDQTILTQRPRDPDPDPELSDRGLQLNLFDRISCLFFLIKFLDQSFLTCSLLVQIPVLSPSMDIDGSWLVYPYSNWRIRIRECANERARPAGPKSPRVDPRRSIEALRATKVDQVARPSRFERPKSTEKGARDAPTRDFRRFRVDFGSNFSSFSRLHRASDSTHSAKGRTSVFAGRRSTFKGSQTLQKNRKSTKIDEKLLPRCFTNAPRKKNSIFSLMDATWRRFWSPQRAQEWSRALFLASRCALRDSLGAPGARRGRPKTLPRRSQDAFGTLLVATVCPERVPGAILSRFWVAQGFSRHRFSVDFRGDFRLVSRASWPANGITLDG